MIAPQVAAALLTLVLRQQTFFPPVAPDLEAPGAAVNPIRPTAPPSSTGEVPQATPAPTPPPPPPPFTPAPDRISFALPFPAEKGGGQATGSAGALEYQREDFAVLTGGVELHYKDLVLHSEEVSVDLQTKQLTALGNVVIDQGPSRLTGATASFDLETRLGTFKNGSGTAPPGFYFTGDRIDKVGDDVFVVDHGTFTSCDGESPSWSFKVNHARIRLQDYAHVKGAGMRVHSVPVFYLPYLVWPTKTDRASGLLFPRIGNSSKRGVSLDLAYYQVFGRSADATLFTDLYSKDYIGIGNEVRYHPTDGTSGAFRGYVVKDPSLDEWRWKVRLDHDSKDLPFGLRGVVAYEDYSDFNFFRDFERGLATSTRSFIYSNAFLSGNWGNQSVNLLVDRRQSFLGASTVTLEQLPDFQYHINDTRVAQLPIYYSLDSEANYFSVDRVTFAGKYERYHLAPQIRVPLSPTPWLSFTLNGGDDFTYYGDSMGVVNGVQQFTGESLTRSLPFVGAELIGPSFSKIYNWTMGPFGKLKHIIEPRMTYGYESNFDEQSRVPLFDQLDNVGGLESGRVSLTNRILGKPTDPTQGDAREIFSLELARRYSFDDKRPLEFGTKPGAIAPDQSQWGPLEVTLRSYPTQTFGLRLDADYSLLFQQLTDVQLGGNVTIGQQSFSLTWSPSWRETDGTEVFNQTVFGTTLHLGQHLTLSSYITYDFLNSLLQNQRHLITWAGSCYALHLELHEQTTSTQRRRDFLFSISLKNVGTFLDLNGGETYGL